MNSAMQNKLQNESDNLRRTIGELRQQISSMIQENTRYKRAGGWKYLEEVKHLKGLVKEKDDVIANQSEKINNLQSMQSDETVRREKLEASWLEELVVIRECLRPEPAVPQSTDDVVPTFLPSINSQSVSIKARPPWNPNFATPDSRSSRFYDESVEDDL